MFWITILLCFALSSVSAQRMSYTPKDAPAVNNKNITLSLESSIREYKQALELKDSQAVKVEKLLKKVRGTNETWEQRKRRFEHQLKVILSEKQYARYESLQ